MTNTPTLQVLSNTKQRIVSIQACRGLAAMFVVFVHLSNVERKDFPTHLTGVSQFGNLGVDLFFVISGVVISTITVGKFSNPRSACIFLKRRLSRIFPIYWFYCVIFLAGYLYNPLWFNNSTGHRVDIIQSFLLIPTHASMLLMQGWTLSYEMYFYLMFFLLLLFIPERLAPLFLSVWGAAIVAGSLFFTPSTRPVLGLIGSPLILEFLAGCLIFHIHRKALLHPRVGLVLVAISVLWLGGVVSWTYYAHGGNQLWIQNPGWTRLTSYGCFAALFLLGLMELERSKIIHFARPFEALGDWSYSIYLSHLAVIEIVGRVTAHFAARVPFSILIVYSIALPLIILLGYVSYSRIELPLMTILYKRAAVPGSSLRPLAPACPNP